jgi:hypothetical protein
MGIIAKGKYFGIILTTIILVIIGLMLYISCKPDVPIITGPVPAYSLKIDYPSIERLVRLERGGSVTLPVTIKSLVDEPIEIRLVLTDTPQVPAFIEYEVPEGYINLNSRGTVDTQIIIKVSEDAQLGSNNVGIAGELQEPIEGRSSVGVMFELRVIISQS